jgi:hypothetical protein
MIAATVMTSLMLPFLGGLFDPLPEAIVDNLLMCAAVHESVLAHSGPIYRRGEQCLGRPLSCVNSIGNSIRLD